ncbi:MAG: TIGR01777 family oxidoreductase [Parachlamydiales bacterium]|nr:TIGR01777 family oxidoreductase [Parachlamydiales bacterium]
MQRILISGASGFIGQPLVSFLERQGHSVISLSRTPEKNAIVWDPEAGKANPDDFEGFDAVIHLAGEPLTLSRWTKSKREKILFSRTIGTMFLAHILKSTLSPPKVFISASAVGFYGDRGEEILNEDSSAGAGFLANVCCAWEKASFSLKDRGIRVVHTRFGIVIGPNGGVLKKLLLPYRLGLGGTLGTGRQWISWVHRTDLIHALSFILQSPSLSGPINIVSPEPIRQKDFAKTIAELLHRPHFLHTPAWALRLVLGIAADELLLSSTRVQSAKLLASKFAFQYSDLRSAVYNALQF